MKLNEIKEAVAVDSVSRKGDVITLRRQFFYRHGKTSADLAERAKLALPGFEVIDHGEHYAAFRGGASVAKSSHWWVRVRPIVQA
jgi:hypothetical protein